MTDEIKVNYSDLIDSISGCDADGKHKTAVSIAIYDVTKPDEPKPLKEAYMGIGVPTIFASGGCVVYQIDFNINSRINYNEMLNICDEWSELRKSQNVAITLQVIPYIFEGQFGLIYQDMVYYTGIVSENTERLILCFNDLYTYDYTSEGINYDEILKTVAQECRREEEAMEFELDETEKEIKELEKNNPYEENLKISLSNIGNIDFSSDEEQRNNEETYRAYDELNSDYSDVDDELSYTDEERISNTRFEEDGFTRFTGEDN